MRYYISNSSIFDNTNRIYDIPLFSSVVRQAGGSNVRKARGFGWSNQPYVVTWSGTKSINTKIKEELGKLSQFKIWGPIIYEKDW